MSEENNERLNGFIGRIQRLEAEKKTIAEDIKGVYQEVKSAGYDSKILKQVVKALEKERNEILEEQDLFRLYFDKANGA